MKKTALKMLASILVVMVLLPLSNLIWDKTENAFALAFVMIYAVIPVFMAALGAVCGRRGRALWAMPVAAVAALVLTMWGMTGQLPDPLFPGIYFALGMISLLCSALTDPKHMK